METEPNNSIESLEVLWEFNRSMHLGIMSLDALTRNRLFDADMLKALAADIVKAKAATNAYLVQVIFPNETAIASNDGRSRSSPKMERRDTVHSSTAAK